MPYPAGVQTVTLRLGSSFDSAGTLASVSGYVMPIMGGGADHLVWSATGQTYAKVQTKLMWDDTEKVAYATVPHPSQAGWRDQTQASFSGWSYKITARATYASGEGHPFERTVTPQPGDTVIDVDLLPNGVAATPTVVAEWEAARAAALAALNATNAAEVEQVTLTGDVAYTLPAGASPNRVHSVVFTQDATGGHPVTYDDQPVTVDLTAGASTVVELHPVGAGYVVRYPVTNLDAQVSALAEDGGSALGASLSSTYAARLAARNEFADDFGRYPNGWLPDRSATSQEYVDHYATQEARVRVVDGYATFDPAAIAGGYASVELDADVVRIGGLVKFTPQTVDGGLAAWAITQEEIGSTVTAGRGLPAMAAHLQFSPKTISVQVVPTAGGALVNVFGYTFPTPLVADDSQEYLVELTLDKARGRAYLLIPGEDRIVKMTHEGFSIPARWTYFEPYRNSAGGATGKTLAKFRQVWADSRDLSVVGAAAVAAAPRSPVAVVSAMPTGDQTMTLTNTPTVVPGAEITFTFPPSGKVLLRFSAFVDVTVDGVVYLGYKDADDVTIAIDSVAHKVSHSGKVSTTFVRTGTPGASFTAKMIAFRDVLPTAATLILGQLTTPTRYGKATVEVLDAR